MPVFVIKREEQEYIISVLKPIIWCEGEDDFGLYYADDDALVIKLPWIKEEHIVFGPQAMVAYLEDDKICGYLADNKITFFRDL